MKIIRHRRYIEKTLAFKLLMHMYANSRMPVSKLANLLGITPYYIKKTLNMIEEKYDIVYTLQLNNAAMGFPEGRIVMIKFEIMPEINYLRERFNKDIVIQDAYLSTGDFDLVIYAVGLNYQTFLSWQFKLRQDLSKYKPIVKITYVGTSVVGFFPLRNELITKSNSLSDLEKKILSLLNSDAKTNIRDIAEKTKSSQIKVIRILNKLKKANVIVRYSGLIQKTDKPILMAYAASYVPIPEHHRLRVRIRKEITNEDFEESSNDYCIILDGDGAFNSLYICTFKDSESLYKRGPFLLERLWAEEYPELEKAMLVDVLVGKWPFHLEDYNDWLKSFDDAIEPNYDILTGKVTKPDQHMVKPG